MILDLDKYIMTLYSCFMQKHSSIHIFNVQLYVLNDFATSDMSLLIAIHNLAEPMFLCFAINLSKIRMTWAPF